MILPNIKSSSVIQTEILKFSREGDRVMFLINDSELKLKNYKVSQEVLFQEIAQLQKENNKKNDTSFIDKIIKLKEFQIDTLNNSTVPTLKNFIDTLKSQNASIKKEIQKLSLQYEESLTRESEIIERNSVTVVSLRDLSSMLVVNQIKISKGDSIEILITPRGSFIKLSDSIESTVNTFTTRQVDYNKVVVSNKIAEDSLVEHVTKTPIFNVDQETQRNLSEYTKFISNFESVISIDSSSSIILIDDDFNIGENSLWCSVTNGVAVRPF